jgi:hypothetical protein
MDAPIHHLNYGWLLYIGTLYCLTKILDRNLWFVNSSPLSVTGSWLVATPKIFHLFSDLHKSSQFLPQRKHNASLRWLSDDAPCRPEDIGRRFRDRPDDGGSKHLWTFVSFFQTTLSNIPEDSHRHHTCGREDLKSHNTSPWQRAVG